MGSATRLHVCRYCGGTHEADETACTGCGARLERSGTGATAAAHLLDMSARMTLLLRRSEIEREGRHRLRTRIGMAVAMSLVMLFGLSTFLVSLAGSTPGIRVYPSAAAARSAVEERQRDIAYQMMLLEGGFTEHDR